MSESLNGSRSEDDYADAISRRLNEIHASMPDEPTVEEIEEARVDLTEATTRPYKTPEGIAFGDRAAEALNNPAALADYALATIRPAQILRRVVEECLPLPAVEE